MVAAAPGVGKIGAWDGTSSEPMTNFTHSNYLYRLAMRYNRGLDRDQDGIAREKLSTAGRAVDQQRFLGRRAGRAATRPTASRTSRRIDDPRDWLKGSTPRTSG
jgi:hypothetical protein